MFDSNQAEDDLKKCRMVGLIAVVVLTAIVTWILAAMGLPVWLLVILALLIALGLFYVVNNYCQDQARAAANAAADATKRDAAERAAAERSVAEEHAKREAADAAELQQHLADARAAVEQAAAEERGLREAAEAAEAQRRREDAEAREATERAAAEERALREAAEAAEAQRRREDAEAREVTERDAAERVAAEQAAAETSGAGPAASTQAADDIDRDGDGVIEGVHEGTRPEALTAPRGGVADDLKKIKGVGAKLELLCNKLGFYHFDQIASWTPDEVAWVDSNLQGFKGRVTRENWVEQAKVLAAGGETEFSKRV